MEFWKNRRITITGGKGFLGSFIIEKLQDRGFDIWAFDWRGQGLSSRDLGERQKGHIHPKILSFSSISPTLLLYSVS